MPEQYERELREWEAAKPKEMEVKPKGNSMTQKYYCEHILPQYIRGIHERAFNEGVLSHYFFLQEDGDPSHSKRGRGLAQALRDDNGIIRFEHPAQSPDLNPNESIWAILKQRVRRRSWDTLEELKQVLREEWDGISQHQIQERIKEMPYRYYLVLVMNGARVITEKW